MKGLQAFLLVLSFCFAAHCNADGMVFGVVDVVDSAGETVLDRSGIVVFVEGADPMTKSELAAMPKPNNPHVSHKGFTFQPRVLPIVQGTAVDFLNDDGAYHNAFSVSKAKPFDLGIYPQGTSKAVSFDKTGLVRIYCNIHPKMISNILVLNNSFYTVSQQDGSFSIDGLPSGEFTLRFWGEFIDELSAEFTLDDRDQIELNVAVTRKARFKKHANKFGKPYRSKY